MGSEKAVYRFDGFTLDLGQGALRTADGGELALRPKSFALLRHMVEHAGRLVDRDEVMRAVWPGVFVTDDSIAQCVKEVRRALGDDTQRVLRTLPRRGYLLAAPVSRVDAAGGPGAAAAAPSVGSAGELPRPPTGRPMLVVLPFENIGGDPEQSYFAAGLTADLVTDLTRFQGLHVVSPLRRHLLPSLAAAPAGAPPDGADYVFGGGVRRAGGRVRVTAQLCDARTGVALWAERFDRPLDDLFAVQEDLADRIAALLDDQIGREGLRRARLRPPSSLDAYDLFLQGRELLGRTNERDTLAARRAFDGAIAADPDHAPAYAYQAYAVQRGFTLGWGEPRGRAALEPALDLAGRAVALEPGSSLCIMRFAFGLSLLGRDEEALEEGAAGVRANPCDAASRATHGEILSRAGRHEVGIAELRLALSLNPFHPPFLHATLGRALLLAGHSEEALGELRRCAALAPDYRPCHSSMVVACVEAGRMEEARAAMREVLRLRPGWTLRDYDGVFGLRRGEDTARFLDAFRAAGMPEG
jgi:TolB-like protein/Flp pilus assembly protein TadD